MSEPTTAAPEHPTKADGSPYPFGGYAFLRLGCRCQDCRDKQSQTGSKGSKAQKAKKAAGSGSRAERAGNNLRSVDGGAERVGAVVTDLAEQARARAKTPRGGASQSELEDVAGQVLVYLSIGYVWLSGRDLNLPDEVADKLALSDDEATDIAAPLARAFAGTELNSKYGRGVVQNADVPVAVFTLGMYVRRVNRTLAAWRAELLRLQAQAPHPYPTGGPTHVAPHPEQRADTDTTGGGGGEQAQEVPPPRFVGQPFNPGDQLRAD